MVKGLVKGYFQRLRTCLPLARFEITPLYLEQYPIVSNFMKRCNYVLDHYLIFMIRKAQIRKFYLKI